MNRKMLNLIRAGALTPPAAFPDATSCKVKPSDCGTHHKCLGYWRMTCPYLVTLGADAICRFEDVTKIVGGA